VGSRTADDNNAVPDIVERVGKSLEVINSCLLEQSHDVCFAELVTGRIISFGDLIDVTCTSE